MASVVPVAIEGWTTSSWLLASLHLLIGGGGIAAFISVWPKLKDISSREKANDQKNRRDDLDDMRARITELEREVHASKEAAHASEMKLVYAINAIQLLAGKVRAQDPDDPILTQAMELLSAAITGELESGARRLARGISEKEKRNGKT